MCRLVSVDILSIYTGSSNPSRFQFVVKHMWGAVSRLTESTTAALLGYLNALKTIRSTEAISFETPFWALPAFLSTTQFINERESSKISAPEAFETARGNRKETGRRRMFGDLLNLSWRNIDPIENWTKPSPSFSTWKKRCKMQGFLSEYVKTETTACRACCIWTEVTSPCIKHSFTAMLALKKL